jgi:protein tyrosine phosphatase (PTP) superfamily phosphohydrolase (DUF442 family)
MRVTILIATVCVLASAASALGQNPSTSLGTSPSSSLGASEWTEFVSREDGFRITFPGTPKIQPITWTSQMGYPLPARVFTVDRGREHYSVTVADYRGIEKLGIARSQSCTPGAETCIGGQTRIVGPGYWKSDLHGAITYAVFKLLQRDAKLTGMTWNWAEQVEGTLLQFTNNADQSRTSASIYMHDNRLYVIEGTVPKGYPEPELFKMSIGFIRPDGTESNIYSSVYNAYMGLGESPLPDLCGLRGCNAGAAGANASAAGRPKTRREDFPGLARYFPIDGTASNGGLIQSADWVVSELWRRGFKTFIDVAPGRDADAVARAARGVGMKYVAMPIAREGASGQLDAAKIDPVLNAIRDPGNQPVFLHSPDGRSTAMLWMIKRIVNDGWTVEQAGAEATTIGLVDDDPSVPALWKFAQDYVAAHGKR